jgi:hypothetical protein
MLKKLRSCFALALLAMTALPGALAASDDNWFDPAYLEADTLYGGTGFVVVPSPEVLPGGVISAAIHRYQVKVGYGFFDRLELGLTANLDGYVLRTWRDLSQNQLFYGRLRLLDSERYGMGLSLGSDGLGPEDLGATPWGFKPRTDLANLQRYYAVAGGVLPFYQSLMLTAGWEMTYASKDFFFNVSKVVIPGLLAMAEYDGQYSNFGARFLLSPRVKLDLDFQRAQDVDRKRPFADVLDNNIRFGISYSEPWPARAGQD